MTMDLFSMAAPAKLTEEDYEAMAQRLEATGDYRILRRLRPRDVYTQPPAGVPIYTGIILDTETTGLDTTTCEVIELGMVRFTYGADGAIYQVTGRFNQLQEPSTPLAAEIVRLTGLTDADLAGRAIEAEAVEAFVAGANLVIAHNAAFDRPIAERLWPVFTNLNWACSLDQVAWRDEGFEGSKLGYLLAGLGLFHTGHRASDDCEALLHLLATPLPASRKLALSALLDRARRPIVRLWAQNSPFDLKDVLKARGYRWSDGNGGTPKAWWCEVDEELLEAELLFLKTEIYLSHELDLPTRRITARERYSGR